MRFLLEAKSKLAEGKIEELVKKEKTIIQVDAYEPIEKLSREVEKVGLALRAFKKSGISWDVFETYLKGKGHSRNLINGFMGDVKEFFTQLGLLPEKKWNEKKGKYE